MIRASLVAAMLTVITGSAMASPVIYDRGLPTTNLNDAAGANRSNVAWGYGPSSPPYYAGDDFTLGAGTYRIDTVRTWAIIGGASDTSASLLADRYSSIALYGGSGANLNQLMSGNTVGNGTNNANISITKVQYAGGANYESFGNQLSLFEVTFNNLNWVVDGSVQQFFSVAGVDNAADNVFRPWFMSASNAALGGSTADGADDLYSTFFENGGMLAYDSTGSSLGNGWDKASDINVQIEAERLPEPGSLFLLGLGLIGLTAARRARRQANHL